MLTSIIRTFVPWLVALVGPWLLRNLGVSEVDLSAVLTVLVGAAYYALARLLERINPRFGLLLGVPSQPTYPPTAGGDGGKGIPPAALGLALVAVLASSALLTAPPAQAHGRRHQPAPPVVAALHPEVVRLTMTCDHAVYATVRIEQMDGQQWGPADAQMVRLQGIGGMPGGWRAVGSGQSADGGAVVQVDWPPPVQVRAVASDGSISAPVGVPEMPEVSCV